MKPTPPKRKAIRLRKYDYSTAGLYFITICTDNKKCLFGFIRGGEMVLNEAGKMIEFWWKKIPEKFPSVKLDVFITMPNHFHGIIFIPYVGADPCVRPSQTQNQICVNHGRTHGSAPTIPAIIQWFKTMTMNDYIRNVKTNSWKPFHQKIWQRTFYDHIIRNEKSLEKIRDYVVENPYCWEKDVLFVKN